MRLGHIAAALLLAFALALGGCEKKLEDSDTYQEIIRHNEEVQKKTDSIKKDNYNEVLDSNRGHLKSLDSLRRITDSLKQNLDKNIQDLKTKKY